MPAEPIIHELRHGDALTRCGLIIHGPQWERKTRNPTRATCLSCAASRNTSRRWRIARASR